MSRVLLTGLAIAAIAAAVVGVQAERHNMPQRLRGGSVYQQLLASHEDHLKATGQFVNKTANIFNQIIDHSSPNSGTFQQRYWIDLSNVTLRGPGNSKVLAMLYINGESEAYNSPDGFVGQFGHELGAALFTPEHRYYGLSLPAPYTDKTTLRTLNVENVLADLYYFMEAMEKLYFPGKTVTWFCSGGSYSGALSAWLRQKYPTKVVAAWSSSGVVNTRFDFYDFDASIANVIPPVCADNIRTVYRLFGEQYDTDNGATVKSIFGTPNYYSKTDMAWMMADGAAMAVQYGTKDALCNALTPLASSPTAILAQYAALIQQLWGQHFTASCYYSTACLSGGNDPTMTAMWVPDGFGWNFQTCYQLGYWQSGYPGSLRRLEITTDYYTNQCRSAFWADILPNTYAFNRQYNGALPKIDKVIALQGSDDPWQYAGVRESRPNYPMVLAECHGCGHCGDMMPPRASDPPSLTKQREAIRQYMTMWINQAL